jgi:trans-aconitate 2-methyltransferase
MPWDPQQYHKFQAERFAPFDDLVRLVTVRPGLRVVDLGCGTGELTRRLADMLPESDVLGLDSSPEMLAKAEQHVRPGLRFERGDIATVAGEWDLVFSHAAIQWVDDHEALVPRLFGLVRPGGQLAVQQPNNHTHPAHRAIFEIAGQEPFRTALDGWSRAWPQLPLERYAALLFEHGAENITVLEKVYTHVLADSDAVAEWTRGTALVPYLERLSSNMRETFLDAYRARLRAVLPGSPVFYGFRRMLVVAARPA